MLLYAPPTPEARFWFEKHLSFLGQSANWHLQPVAAGSNPRSSDLSALLANAMVQAKHDFGNGPIGFIGSDAPELPIAELQVQ